MTLPLKLSWHSLSVSLAGEVCQLRYTQIMVPISWVPVGSCRSSINSFQRRIYKKPDRIFAHDRVSSGISFPAKPQILEDCGRLQ